MKYYEGKKQKQVMIRNSKVTKVQVNQQKQLQVTEMKVTWLFHWYIKHMAQSTIDVEYTWHAAAEILANARKAQSIVVVKYTWFHEAQIKCQESVVYPSR